MQCPGQDNRYWEGEAVFEVACPHCGNALEFFKDDSQRSCKNCGKKVLNPRIDFGCAAYCSHAEQCLGAMPPELLAKQKNLFKDKLALAVRKQLLPDDSLFKQANLRAEIAEQLCKHEQRGDMAVVVAATLLLDTKNSESILEELQATTDMIAAVDDLIKQHTPVTEMEQASADIFHDACLLATLQASPEIESEVVFKTKSGLSTYKKE